ncbi:MAG TPA: cytochrome c oxidase subunit II [Bryobacteraceae bacterium]|nr:cytochrome c oxidase subunit II [Bryobacteraceae bacterium]
MDFPLWPVAASNIASDVDHLYIYLVLVSAVMTLLIFATIFVFAIKYRRRSPDEVPAPIHGSLKLEITWSIIPFLIMLTFFWWGAKIFFLNATPPPDSMDVYVVGKQWMWKIQYPGGQREINELHVPVGRPVKVTLASEDVIHSFFIPAFRIKHDVVPGRYDTMWFTATKPGRYHLFCAEYCGTEHSGMVGWVTVMSPIDYENWLAGGGTGGTMAQQGEQLFEQLGCSNCHLTDRQGRGPNLRGVFGSHVQLTDGRSVSVDDVFIRESILNPNAKIVEGYRPNVMPNFQGQVTEEQILQLIAYIKSLAIPGTAVAPVGTQPASATQPIGGKL